jgi:hypothetical protein
MPARPQSAPVAAEATHGQRTLGRHAAQAGGGEGQGQAQGEENESVHISRENKRLAILYQAAPY